MELLPIDGNQNKDCGCCGDSLPAVNECFCHGLPYSIYVNLSGTVDTYGVAWNRPSGTGCGWRWDPFNFGSSLPPPAAPDITGNYFMACRTGTRYVIYDQPIGQLNCGFPTPYDYRYRIYMDIIDRPQTGDLLGNSQAYEGLRVTLRATSYFDTFFPCFDCSCSCGPETSVVYHFPWIRDPNTPTTYPCPTDFDVAESVVRTGMTYFGEFTGPDEGFPVGGNFDVSNINITAHLITN